MDKLEVQLEKAVKHLKNIQFIVYSDEDADTVQGLLEKVGIEKGYFFKGNYPRYVIVNNSRNGLISTGVDCIASNNNQIWGKKTLSHFVKNLESPDYLMKTYLQNNICTYNLIKGSDYNKNRDISAIEIPKDADVYCEYEGVYYWESRFYKDNFSKVWLSGKWEDFETNEEHLNDIEIVWRKDSLRGLDLKGIAFKIINKKYQVINGKKMDKTQALAYINEIFD